MRCTTTGMAKAPRPARNNGVRNDMCRCEIYDVRSNVFNSITRWRCRWKTRSSDPAHFLPARQVTEQRPIERLGGVQQGIVDPLLREPCRQGTDVFLDVRSILLAERLRHHRYLLAILQVLERRRIV